MYLLDYQSLVGTTFSCDKMWVLFLVQTCLRSHFFLVVRSHLSLFISYFSKTLLTELQSWSLDHSESPQSLWHVPLGLQPWPCRLGMGRGPSKCGCVVWFRRPAEFQDDLGIFVLSCFVRGMSWLLIKTNLTILTRDTCSPLLQELMFWDSFLQVRFSLQAC